MAGNYPDVPSWRMPYDRDGTQVYHVNTNGVVTQLTSGQISTINDENDTGYTAPNTAGVGTVRLAFIFPELRDLSALFVKFQGSTLTFSGVEVSANTTNGIDGTWSSVSFGSVSGLVNPDYRLSITSASASAIRGIRMNAGSAIANATPVFIVAHFYGVITTGQNPDRLALWHPTLNQRLSAAYFDWDDIPRNTSATTTFRVKNLSSTLTANTPRVAMEILTDGSPSVPGWHALSLDGTTWLSQVNPGSLAPGAISGVITLRRVTPSNAQLSVWAFRVFSEATSWS